MSTKTIKPKKPLIRVVKRAKPDKRFMVLYYLCAIVLALGVGALLLKSLDIDFVKFYKEMLTIGTLDNKFYYKNIEGFIKLLIPLIITSLALSLAFRMKFWNIGGEGQFIVGALSGGAVALKLGGSVNPLLLVLLMALVGGLVAGLYGMIVAVFKVRFGTNETLLTLMFNYIALYLLKYFGETKTDFNIFLDPASVRPRFLVFNEGAWMPSIKIGVFSLNISLIFALILTVLISVYLSKTKQGYELSVVGDSINTAKYAGMKVNRIIIRTVFLSAFLIGVAGAWHVSTSHTMSTSITNSVGWTGIIVAWLSKLNPVFIFVTSVLITVLQFGCQVANTNFSSIDSNFANLLQGIILFLILAADFFIRFKIVINLKSNKKGA